MHVHSRGISSIARSRKDIRIFWRKIEAVASYRNCNARNCNVKHNDVGRINCNLRDISAAAATIGGRGEADDGRGEKSKLIGE